MAKLVFQDDPWASGPPDAVEYGDPAWFRGGPNAGLFGPLAWDTAAARGFDWTDLAFFTKYIHLLTLTGLSENGFTADLRLYGDAASAVSFTGQDFGFLWPWPGATGAGLSGGTVDGFSGTIQGRGALSITGLSVPVASLQALASRADAAALVEANDLLLAGDDAVTGSRRNDALRGGPGDDTLAGGAGDDLLDGGAGHDTAAMGHAGFRGAGVGRSPGDGVVLTSAAGTDTLTGIEAVAFADGRLVFDAADPAAQVARLYEAALDRLPDQAGLNAWTDAVRDGRPIAELARAFLGSAEFQARFGGTAAGDGDFVDRLYLNVLGRAGEAEGRGFWVDALGTGAGRADVLVAFSEGAENRAGTAGLVGAGIWDRSEAAAQVARLYDTVFGRLPDAPGLVAWKEALENGGATLAQVADAFVGGAEFRAEHGGLGNRGFVDALYANALDRAADQAGLDFWTARLDAGTARSAVALAISECPEHARLTARSVQGDNPAEFGILFA